ncbi:UNVERIFIED_CONTAM: hypothetical protein GTU68_046352 [Idotea baltica]|nr:hypothetical protein [Idotea baltica]
MPAPCSQDPQGLDPAESGRPTRGTHHRPDGRNRHSPFLQ